MRRFALACLTVITSLGAGAAKADQLQWEKNDKAMVDYVADGFELKAVNYSQDAAGSWTTYFLQKGAKLAKCDQNYMAASRRNGVVGCFELVKPFEAKSK